MTEAWITLATSDWRARGAITLLNSLHLTGTNRRIHCLITNEISSGVRQELESKFDDVSVVDVFNSNDAENLTLIGRPDLGVTFTKLHCWRLTQYTKAVFLDADTMVIRNSDELFERPDFSAAADIGWPDMFNSGVFVFSPSLDTYRALIALATSAGSFDGGDQGLLNEFFSNWRDLPSLNRLPFIYNTSIGTFYYHAPSFRKNRDQIKIVQFIGAHQQYSTSDIGIHKSQHYQQWLKCFQLVPSCFSEAHLPPSPSQIKRQEMIYHCKFGQFGVMVGQFAEPAGIAAHRQGDIVVADTSNHRIQVFDKEGRFKFQFGECGKRDGQLLYPHRVAVNITTGDFVVTERSPPHQIQVYNQYGSFLLKFGAGTLKTPTGLCVDNNGLIIVVECEVPRIIIFDMSGHILQAFSCSSNLKFPTSICTNDKKEIFCSDLGAHCIKVFSYEGQYLRQIGGEGVTNYPIGVGINSLGEVVVADNHNNFNLTVFSQDGAMIGALESRVKHAACLATAIVDDGTVVLASNDHHLYIYRLPASGSYSSSAPTSQT